MRDAQDSSDMVVRAHSGGILSGDQEVKSVSQRQTQG